MHDHLRSLLVASGIMFGLPMENWTFDLFCTFVPVSSLIASGKQPFRTGYFENLQQCRILITLKVM